LTAVTDAIFAQKSKAGKLRAQLAETKEGKKLVADKNLTANDLAGLSVKVEATRLLRELASKATEKETEILASKAIESLWKADKIGLSFVNDLQKFMKQFGVDFVPREEILSFSHGNWKVTEKPFRRVVFARN